MTESQLAPIIAKAKEAGGKAGKISQTKNGRKPLGQEKKTEAKQKYVTKLSQAGYKVPETEEECVALCSVIKNGKTILRMTDPDFFYPNLALNAAAFKLGKDVTEEEKNVFLEQTADHWRMLIPVSGRFHWTQARLKKNEDEIEMEKELKAVKANLETSQSKIAVITAELEQAKKEIEKLKACVMM